jgi:5-oxopent-3-ene-1,2,5-tricarboxylate decarboxylase/2-hydroxyhepta-2,4-diene-1,7-dioate isomerase
MDDLIERFGHIPVATVCDAFATLKLRPVERHVMRRVRPLGSLGTRAVGRARTQQLVSLRDPSQSSLVANRELHFEIVDRAKSNDFLVIAASGRDQLASFGDVLALKAHTQGVAGVVIDGATRDAGYIVELGLPVWCDGIAAIPQGYGGYSVSAVDVTVTCAGVEVRPGDYVIADGDGVIVVPPDEADRVIVICEELEAKEQRAREGIAAGTDLAELYPSRAYYAKGPEETS